MRILLVHIALALFAVTGHAREMMERPPVFVVTEAAVKKSVSPTVLYSGTLISRDDAYLAGEVPGHLTWVADVGSRFRKGETVAKLDDVFIRQQLIEEQSIIQSEKARYEYHTRQVERFSKLLTDDNIALSQVDAARRDQSVAHSNILSAKARLVQAEEHLRRTQIIAPFDGIVSERRLQAGEWADKGEAIVRLVSSENLEIQTHIPSSVLPFVTVGAPLTYSHGKFNGTGRVRTLVPIGGDLSRLYELRISISDASLSAGTLLRVAIPTAHPREVVLVPRDALVLRREAVYVFRVNEQSVAERVAVQTGIAESDSIEVMGGIRESDRVITRGGENLQPGMVVKVQPLLADP